MDCFSKTKILSKAAASSRLSDLGLEKCYSDPLLRVPRVYGKFLKSLHVANCVEFSFVDDCLEIVECFFVAKKNGKLRLVIDARRSNCHFATPLHTHLCTGDGLSRIELEEGEVIHIAASDLKDAFYHIELPEAWRTYFGLRSVRARDVGITSLNGQALNPEQVMFPRLRVCPMGWSWAVFWCQLCVQRVVSTVPELADDSRIVDGRPVPSQGNKHAIYIDNLFNIGTSAKNVCERAEKGAKALRSAGLIVHEEEVSSDAAPAGSSIIPRISGQPSVACGESELP